MLKRVCMYSLLGVILLTFLVGCSSTSTTENNENYLYNENNPYNTQSVSDSNTIYVFIENKIVAIDKKSYEYRFILEADHYIGDIALYNDWIYYIEGFGQLDYTRLSKISKDGKENVELLSDALYLYCWVYKGTFYVLNGTNNSLVEAFLLDEEGNLKENVEESNDFLFKTFNEKQNAIINEYKAQNSEASDLEIKNMTLFAFDYSLLNIEGYSRLTYNIDISKENLNEAGYTWVIKKSGTEEKIASLDVFNDRIMIMNGEIAYVDQEGLVLNFTDFKGNEIENIETNDAVLGILNYDSNWIYYYTNTDNTNTNRLCCRINRSTFEEEVLFDGLSSSDSYFYSFFEVYDGLLLYTEYQSDSQKVQLVMYDTNTGEKKYIE